jgi:hypothetical protein
MCVCVRAFIFIFSYTLYTIKYTDKNMKNYKYAIHNLD